ncbi:type VI secretion system protein TssA, partial [Pyxidicoccus fallax]
MPLTLEELQERARPWSEPVPGATPAGVQAKHEPAYEAITTEVAKLESPASAGVRWDNVVDGAGELLKSTTKDLWLASYMAYGLYATRGLDGAATGAAVIAEVTERYWPDLFPELKRLRGRANAVGWFVERLGRMLPTVDQATVTAESLEALAIAVKRLAQLSRERFADAAPAFGPLQDAIARLRAGLPEPTPAPEPAPANAATAPDTTEPERAARDLTNAGDAQASGSQANGTQASGAQANGSQTSGAQTSGAQASGSQANGSQVQGAQASGSQASGTQASGAQAQGAQASGTQAQGAQKPGTPSASAQPPGTPGAQPTPAKGAAQPASAQAQVAKPTTPAAPAKPAASVSPIVVPPLPSLPATPDLSSAEAVTDFLRTVGTALLGAAGALRQASAVDPLPYRLLRQGLWLHLSRPPAAGANGRTSLKTLPDAVRKKLETLESNQRWADLLDESESAVGQHRFALVLHRYSVTALEGLGDSHESALTALVQELGNQLRRMPGVEELLSADGTPLTDEATRAWLRAKVLAT